MIKKCLVIANGELPSKKIIINLIKRGYETIFCADGGANSLHKKNIIPNYIVGDFDSIKDDVLKFYSDKSEIINYKRQNDTDVEKCIKLAIRKKFNQCILVGATGDRLDHSFHNMAICLKFNSKINISLLHKESFLKVYSGNIELATIPNETISLYGFDERTTIQSEGLKYPLKNISLPFGKREGTSNVATKDKVHLKINGGIIFVIRDYKNIIKNGIL